MRWLRRFGVGVWYSIGAAGAYSPVSSALENRRVIPFVTMELISWLCLTQ